MTRFVGQEVVVTAKMDGEQSTLYTDFIHARSLEPLTGEDRSWVKRTWDDIRWDIPAGWRVNGENVYAKHSIHYRHLPEHRHPYFFVWGIWNDRNECLSWGETEEWAKLLGVQIVPTLHRGVYDETLIKALYTPTYNGDECEGYVVRLAQGFSYGDFKDVVAKYVRPGHITTDRHWQNAPKVPNEVGPVKSDLVEEK
jgi:hypothetical protein